MLGDEGTPRASAATAVSGCTHRVGAFVQTFEGLARWSLALGSMLALTGCLDGTPEYRVPTRAPPVIITSEVTPATTEVALIPEQQDTVPFSIPFRSEDEDEKDTLVYTFWKNLDPAQTQEDTSKLLGIGGMSAVLVPFDEQGNPERTIHWTWTVGTHPTGSMSCVSVTMILTHDRNKVQGTAGQPIDEARAARVTWWFDFQDSNPDTPEIGCLPPDPGGT